MWYQKQGYPPIQPVSEVRDQFLNTATSLAQSVWEPHEVLTTMDYIEEDIEEGKGLLEDSRQGPDLWRDRFSGSRNRIRSYNTNTSSHSLSSSSDIPLRGQNKSDVSDIYCVFF